MQPVNKKLLISPHDISPSHESLKVVGTFNPGAERFKDEIVLLVRVAESAQETRDNMLASPRLVSLSPQPNYEIDWFPNVLNHSDPRKFPTPDGRLRLSTVSHLEIVRLTQDGQTIKSIDKHPQLFGSGETENFGIEDPRITQIDDTYYITYVAVSSVTGITTALIRTKDFASFERLGTIFPCENKDVVLFPEKINGNCWAYHRPVPQQTFNALAIQSAESPDLLHWGNYSVVLGGDDAQVPYFSRIGASSPPLKTQDGWLTLYHAVSKQPGDSIGSYFAYAMLSDLRAPNRVIAKTKQPILQPSESVTQSDFMKNVIFPTGVILDGEELIIFSGVNDTNVEVMDLPLNSIQSELVYLS